MGRKKLNNKKDYYIKKKLTYDDCKFIEMLLLNEQLDTIKQYCNNEIELKEFKEIMDFIYKISLKLSFLHKDCYHENEVE